ncbi:hypothetical protein N7492_009451 [Penicillium capsulatum]|uniref:Uncharacterized protein n=1 Tax=Penicillium capsulatum TaxID=69766 RepID=A0A9W9HU00_9EURO|nr:hypothetical protein N7492_009451 [Penicillium capsulatum]KAJ6106843.1 hypothetical protein N7512_010360 [Penicillium capsulatum]
MSGPVDPQIDIGNLSLAGLGGLSTVLGVLSADDVQPITLLQLEQLGAAFPISGPLRAEIPDHLQRCRSTRLNRLGVMIGWRKGDAASLMAHSAGGQAVALLTTCLVNIYGNDITATICYSLSKALLPNSARISSPKQLTQATEILSRKLGSVGFGTILAKQVCRIHAAYRHIAQKAPQSLLASLKQEGISDLFIKCSRALCEDKYCARFRGCASMGYIVALIVTLFSDDCIVTVENMIIHKGCRSSSITIEITTAFGDSTLQVQSREKVDTFMDIPVKRAKPSKSLGFSYRGHLASYMQLHLQEMGLLCSPDVLVAMGTCILSLTDSIYISVGECIGNQSKSTTGLFGQLLGEFPRTTIRDRCEFILGVSLPLKWGIFSDTLARLQHVLARSNGISSLPQALDAMNRRGDPTNVLLRIIDEGIASLAVRAHEGAVWHERSDHEIWSPSETMQKYGTTHVTMSPQELLYKLFSWDDANIIAKSDASTTLVPSGIVHLGNDLCSHRDVELFDGLVYHENRYHGQIFSEVDYNFWSKPELQNTNIPRVKSVHPTMEGVHSDLSLTLVEHVHGLALECSVTAAGQRQSVNLRERIDQLFGLLDAHPCEHSRKTPLEQQYIRKVCLNTVLMPDRRSEDQISIVQTAGNPTAQFLSLTKWEPAILCRKCCLNCAYEKAREKDIRKIIVA